MNLLGIIVLLASTSVISSWKNLSFSLIGRNGDLGDLTGGPRKSNLVSEVISVECNDLSLCCNKDTYNCVNYDLVTNCPPLRCLAPWQTELGLASHIWAVGAGAAPPPPYLRLPCLALIRHNTSQQHLSSPQHLVANDILWRERKQFFCIQIFKTNFTLPSPHTSLISYFTCSNFQYSMQQQPISAVLRDILFISGDRFFCLSPFSAHPMQNIIENKILIVADLEFKESFAIIVIGLGQLKVYFKTIYCIYIYIALTCMILIFLSHAKRLKSREEN